MQRLGQEGLKRVGGAAPEVIKAGYVTLIASAAAIGGSLFGYDSAVINGAVPGIQATIRSGSAATGFAVASILIGCAIGALFAYLVYAALAAAAIFSVMRYVKEARGRTLEDM